MDIFLWAVGALVALGGAVFIYVVRTMGAAHDHELGE